MPGGSISTSGQEPPSNRGAGYDRVLFTNTNEPERLISAATETSSVLLRTNPDNNGVIYVGFDDDVTTQTGFPMEPGDAITISIDVAEEGIWGVADTQNDDLRWIATE